VKGSYRWRTLKLSVLFLEPLRTAPSVGGFPDVIEGRAYPALREVYDREGADYFGQHVFASFLVENHIG